jgi:PadR family transcriptional regulator, regulatory protein PadR
VGRHISVFEICLIALLPDKFPCANKSNNPRIESEMKMVVTMNVRQEVQLENTKHLLDEIVLQLLSKKAMCGYEIILAIKKTYGIYFGASTIYPMLSSLERQKLVEGKWDPNYKRPKKNYKLTPEGQKKVVFNLNSILIPQKT